MNKAYRTAGRLFLKASPDEEGIDPETQAKIDAADQYGFTGRRPRRSISEGHRQRRSGQLAGEAGTEAGRDMTTGSESIIHRDPHTGSMYTLDEIQAIHNEDKRGFVQSPLFNRLSPEIKEHLGYPIGHKLNPEQGPSPIEHSLLKLMKADRTGEIPPRKMYTHLTGPMMHPNDNTQVHIAGGAQASLAGGTMESEGSTQGKLKPVSRTQAMELPTQQEQEAWADEASKTFNNPWQSQEQNEAIRAKGGSAWKPQIYQNSIEKTLLKLMKETPEDDISRGKYGFASGPGKSMRDRSRSESARNMLETHLEDRGITPDEWGGMDEREQNRIMAQFARFARIREVDMPTAISRGEGRASPHTRQKLDRPTTQQHPDREEISRERYSGDPKHPMYRDHGFSMDDMIRIGIDPMTPGEVPLPPEALTGLGSGSYRTEEDPNHPENQHFTAWRAKNPEKGIFDWVNDYERETGNYPKFPQRPIQDYSAEAGYEPMGQQDLTPEYRFPRSHGLQNSIEKTLLKLMKQGDEEEEEEKEHFDPKRSTNPMTPAQRARLFGSQAEPAIPDEDKPRGTFFNPSEERLAGGPAPAKIDQYPGITTARRQASVYPDRYGPYNPEGWDPRSTVEETAGGRAARLRGGPATSRFPKEMTRTASPEELAALAHAESIGHGEVRRVGRGVSRYANPNYRPSRTHVTSSSSNIPQPRMTDAEKYMIAQATYGNPGKKSIEQSLLKLMKDYDTRHIGGPDVGTELNQAVRAGRRAKEDAKGPVTRATKRLPGQVKAAGKGIKDMVASDKFRSWIGKNLDISKLQIDSKGGVNMHNTGMSRGNAMQHNRDVNRADRMNLEKQPPASPFRTGNQPWQQGMASANPMRNNAANVPQTPWGSAAEEESGSRPDTDQEQMGKFNAMTLTDATAQSAFAGGRAKNEAAKQRLTSAKQDFEDWKSENLGA